MKDVNLKRAITDVVTRAPSGTVWTPSDFTRLGNRDAVDKTLQRLTDSQDLRRIDRGLYDQPTINKLTGKASAPLPMSIIDAIARRDQIRVLVDGMTAANDLGLTHAIPAKIVVHTDARLRPIQLGNLTITFRPTAASKLFWAGRPAMRLVQALHWLRDIIATDDGAILKKIDQLLAAPGQGELLAADIAAGMAALPDWMQAVLKTRIDWSAMTDADGGARLMGRAWR